MGTQVPVHTSHIIFNIFNHGHSRTDLFVFVFRDGAGKQACIANNSEKENKIYTHYLSRGKAEHANVSTSKVVTNLIKGQLDTWR